MIRVVIERQISAEKVDDYHALIRKAKNKASNVPGFLSGELFSLVEDPNHVVVMSCWDTLEAWNTWAESEQRVDLLDAMRPLLEADERVLVMESTGLK